MQRWRDKRVDGSAAVSRLFSWLRHLLRVVLQQVTSGRSLICLPWGQMCPECYLELYRFLSDSQLIHQDLTCLKFPPSAKDQFLQRGKFSKKCTQFFPISLFAFALTRHEQRRPDTFKFLGDSGISDPFRFHLRKPKMQESRRAIAAMAEI